MVDDPVSLSNWKHLIFISHVFNSVRKQTWISTSNTASDEYHTEKEEEDEDKDKTWSYLTHN